MQNSAGDSTTNKSLPSFFQHLNISESQSIDTISPSSTQDHTMRNAATTTIQGEGSYGDGETEPMVEVGHKRKASREFVLCDSIYIELPPLQPLTNQMVPQEEAEECHPKVEKNEGFRIRQLLGFDQNQRMEGIDNSPDNHVKQETKVEPLVAQNIDVKPFVFGKIEVGPHDHAEKNIIEEKPLAVQKIEVEPYLPNSHEEGPSTTSKNEVESSLKEKNDDSRNAMAFEFDLNELPPQENEN